MTKVWHISDTHLSFDKDFNPIKPMHKRSWAAGVYTFQGYLAKITEFAASNIIDSDIVFITGDITHNMQIDVAINSIKWLRQNIPGTLVLCKGNHDHYLDVGVLKQCISNIHNTFIIDSGEISSIGKFTIGCLSISDLGQKHCAIDDDRYTELAVATVKQASENNKIPIMIGHYPLTRDTVTTMGNAGVKAYLSGHIHCTDAKQEKPGVDGISWYWYDGAANETDNKMINGCFCSTGTIDVLIAKYGVPFKDIACLEQHIVHNKDINNKKHLVMNLFGNVQHNNIHKFERSDPFNPKNHVTGFICRQKGLMGGSLVITHVNGMPVTPQLIYGTPKLAYPYKSHSCRNWMDFPKHTVAVVCEKWNGMNVLFYKYEDVYGNMFYTAKSKGTPFLSDTSVGNFLSLTLEALKGKHISDFVLHINKPDIKAVSYELCGKKEPHLVRYDFDISLKPLFVIFNDGGISPCGSVVRYITDKPVTEVCKEFQDKDFKINIQHRMVNKLPHKYEYEHFATEGKVLYLLDDSGKTINRTMYKIKPSDVEDVHWQTFDAILQGKVREAIRKINSEGGEINENSVQCELDMGPKEWSKFGRQIWEFVMHSTPCAAEMILMVGLPGSGKSTLAIELERTGKYVRVNQDELGSRKACKRKVEQCFDKNKSVIIDRCNFSVNQRKCWIDIAKQYGIKDITVMWVRAPLDVCIERAANRKNHPTIHTREKADKVINDMDEMFVPPSCDEGITKITKIFCEEGMMQVVDENMLVKPF